MQLKKRAAIELSVNFIVIIIISLVVLGMGIYLVNMFVKEASDIKEELDIETEKQIFDLLSGGERVVFPFEAKVIPRGKGDVFGLGVLNILGDDEDFEIILSKSGFIRKGEKELRDWPDANVPLFLESRVKTIENNEQVVLSLPVKVPKGTPLGIYIINVDVEAAGEKYDTTHKIRVTVS